ncbi:MAG TPA: CPBP family intramembrane glutamic endopeptidase [Anaerolineae bacterium]|nr:CPBP family intramembrane glutamic endopeptidase [Anaerolineae bacterium]
MDSANIYLLILTVFILGFLVNWYRNREAIVAYKRIGFLAAIIFACFELMLLAFTRSQFFMDFSVPLVVLAVGWGILRIWAVVNNGIFFSNQLGIRSFPLIAPRLGLRPASGETPAVDSFIAPLREGATGFWETPVVVETTVSRPIESAAAPLASIEPEPVAPAPISPPAIQWPRYWLTIVGLALAAVAYSAVLFLIAQPRIAAAIRDAASADVRVLTPLSLVLIVEFAFVEELIFRLGIQNYLGAKLINKRYGYASAIVLTTVLWTLGHVGSLDPDWVKLLQIFPLGLALGWLYRKQGIESTILVHGLFNVLGALVLPPLYLN